MLTTHGLENSWLQHLSDSLGAQIRERCNLCWIEVGKPYLNTHFMLHTALLKLPPPHLYLYSPLFIIHNYHDIKVKVKVKQSRYRPGVAQRVPGSYGSQIS
jgi:hypothetical protein